jgi:hypothetical protein
MVQINIMNLGGLNVEANFEEPDNHRTEIDEEDIELNLTTNDPIILGRKSLIEIANLSLNIAEDMSS